MVTAGQQGQRRSVVQVDLHPETLKVSNAHVRAGKLRVLANKSIGDSSSRARLVKGWKFTDPEWQHSLDCRARTLYP
jgi:hypothetical protein